MREDPAESSGYASSPAVPYGHKLESDPPSNARIALTEYLADQIPDPTVDPSSDSKRSHEDISATPPAKPATNPISEPAMSEANEIPRNLEESFSDAQQGGDTDVQMDDLTSHDATNPLDASASMLN